MQLYFDLLAFCYYDYVISCPVLRLHIPEVIRKEKKLECIGEFLFAHHMYYQAMLNVHLPATIISCNCVELLH